MNGGEGLPVVACELTALSTAERQRRADLAEAINRATVGIDDLPSGYAFHVAIEGDAATKVNELVALERRCCPFLTLATRTEPASGQLILTITGGHGVKAFIAAQFGAKEAP